MESIEESMIRQMFEKFSQAALKRYNLGNESC
jgi:hypothetical protein